MTDPVRALRRGHVVLVDLDPAVGSEAVRTRPAVVVSNTTANLSAARTGHGVITVVPVTSNISRVHPFQVLLSPEESGLPQPSKAQAEQVRAVSISRVSRVTGRITGESLGALDDALRLHLSL